MARRVIDDLVIIGNGMAGFDLCQRLVDVGATKDMNVVVFGEEPRPAYDRVHLTDYFAKRSSDDLLLKPAQWYADNHIDLRTSDRVEWVDRSHQLVRSASGFQAHYDRLVFATGSEPFVPPVSGSDLPKVFVYRRIEDLEAIFEAAQSAQSAAVMGGGLLGLEAAKALKDMGLETTILEVAARLMPRQLDPDGSALLQKKIEQLGVSFRLVARAQSIEAIPDSRIRLNFDGADPLKVDLLVISAGIRPRDDLAKEIGLEVHDRGGIHINDACQTSDPKIHAIGECAEHDNIVYGLVGPCFRMAEVVTNQVIGQRDFFTGADTSATLKLMGVEVSTIGANLDEVSGGEIRTYHTDDVCRKLIIENNRILGAMSIGSWNELAVIRDMVDEGKRIWPWQITRFENYGHVLPTADALPVSQWPETATVCSCLGVTKKQLECVIQEGCHSIEEIAKATRASTVCGSCKPLLGELCGAKTSPQKERLTGLIVSSVAAVVVFLAILLIPSMAGASTVSSLWHQVDYLWRDDLAKQISGFSLVGIMVLGLALSLRKRIRWIQFGEYKFWRFAHAALGLLCFAGLIVHSGFSLGHNLNFALGATFLALNLLGAMTGIVTGLESRLSGGNAMLLRQWRPRLAYLHIILFWPIPTLILFHVIAVYYF